MKSRGESIRVMHPLFQEGQGGSTPTSPLQMRVEECSYHFAAAFNETFHSVLPRCDSGSMQRGFAVAFAAQFHEKTYAVAIWSSPVARAVDDGSTAELRRFAIAPDAPANTASWMLAIMTKLLAKKFPALRRLISYQAVSVHTGTIYKAAGWTPTSLTKFSAWGTRKRRKPRSAKQRAKAVNGYVDTPSTRRPVQIVSDKQRWELSIGDE